MPPATISPKYILYLCTLGIVLVGAVSGYFLATSSKTSLTRSTTTAGVTTDSTGAKVIGTTDTKTFSDSATGTLVVGGLSGEGTHHLERPGGISQTVYLISSIVDLEEFLGKKVEVGGQTIDAQHVGWLMDVGRVKIVE